MERFKGWAFPPGVDETGRLRTSSGRKLIEESIKLILGTTKGERMARPDFGCELNDLVFSPNNPSTHNSICSCISEAISQWEPRVNVDSVDALPNPDDPARVDISIECTINETEEQLDMEYLFYLERG